MKEIHLQLFACPECQAEIVLAAGKKEQDDRIREGVLRCVGCQQQYEVKNYIPRFVPQENYCQGFGLEWSRHARTQYDSYTGVNLSETRFFQETKWPRNLIGETVLEVGCGSGRFTEHAAGTGAMVVSVDLSGAVEANYALNGHKPNVVIAQADIYKLPFKRDFFDRAFCFGVLQHTPDARRSFMSLPLYLKPGGSLVVDVYKKYPLLKRMMVTKYWVRPLTTKIDPGKLYHWCERYVDFMWPLTRLFNKIPKIGRHINWSLFIADFSNKYPLTNEVAKEWAILDTFDRLSPAYDSPQAMRTIQEWFEEARFRNIEVHFGYNGIEGRGLKA
jgi:SAM-dependent methyltransferase|uniref:Class I SAM-dependent methyltransferase n=1 Tax=Desulfobacca acetoxidans TaxID=60893 RepID=A0A7V6A5Y2_9BACT